MGNVQLSPAEQARYDEILCIADTKLVLAGWHMITIPNGRAIADWNAICGMLQAHYGHARALYGTLSKYGLTRAEAEWDRSAMQIRSADLLDKPPASWCDLIVSTYMVERAAAGLVSVYEKDADAEFAGLAAKISSETQFHFSYLKGWLKVLADSQREELERLAALRVKAMLQWWGPEDGEDAPFAHGQRPLTRDQLRAAFLRDVQSDAATCGFSLRPDAPVVGSWSQRSMRVSREGLPAGLFEMIRFKHIELAMP
jgi:1,2-phenylacetyl-CoA epoxidase catalytic subunit